MVTGESEGADAEQTLADKPMFIFVTDGSGGEDGFDKINKVILDDNKILVGMNAFKCVKMAPEDVEDDPLLSGKSKDDRYFIFVSRDYEDVKVLDGSKMKKKAVYSTMKKFASKAYKTKFDKNVKAVLKLLNEFDKVNNALKTLKQKEEREGDEMSKGEAKKIAKEKEELEERQKKTEAERDRLLTFELKKA